MPLDGAFFDRPMTAHEFHYSTIVSEGEADRMFATQDARGNDLGLAGLRRGQCGRLLHASDRSCGSCRMNAPIVHGGGITAAAARFGGRLEDWLDLSTGINPSPVMLPEMPRKARGTGCRTGIWSRRRDYAGARSLSQPARSCRCRYPARSRPFSFCRG